MLWRMDFASSLTYLKLQREHKITRRRKARQGWLTGWLIRSCAFGRVNTPFRGIAFVV